MKNVYDFQAMDCTFNEVYILVLFVLNTLNDEITEWVLIKIFDHCTRLLNWQKCLLNFVQTNKSKEQNFHEITLFEPWHNITNNNLCNNHCQINTTNENCIMSISSCSSLLFVWISTPLAKIGALIWNYYANPGTLISSFTVSSVVK